MRFRREALKELEAPDKVDEVVRLTTVPSWLMSAALLLIVATAVTWAVVVRVPRTVSAAGVLTHSSGVSALDSAGDGQVTKVWVHANQRVVKGTPLYSVRTTDGKVATRTSPWEAYVVNLLLDEGQLVHPGMHIADMERLDAPGDVLEAVVFVPATLAPRLAVGTPVELSSGAVPSTVFGTLSGAVATVGAFPETAASLRAFLGSGVSTHRYLSHGSVVRVTVPLATDPKSVSGLRWSKAAPPFRLNSQSQLTATFTVSRDHPIDWLLNR